MYIKSKEVSLVFISVGSFLLAIGSLLVIEDYKKQKEQDKFIKEVFKHTKIIPIKKSAI